MIKGKILGLLVLSSILLVVPAQNQGVLQEYGYESDNYQPLKPQTSIKKIAGYDIHDPLEILNDSAFGPSGYNFPGTGTSGDPYRITGYNITNATKDLIYIENTTRYFRISKCYLNSSDSNFNGIYLLNVTHGIIESNSICNAGEDGIAILESSYNTILNNTIHNVSLGIELDSSNNNTLSGNSIFDIPWIGFALISSDNNTLANNTIYDCTIGISSDSSNNTNIFRNTFYDCLKNSIDLQSSTDNMITWNNFFMGQKALNFHGHKYILFDEAKTWTTARTACVDLGGHLVTITDQAENDFIAGMTIGEEIHIGLTDADAYSTEGTFVWVTGEPVTYTNWLTGEPNNAAGVEDYVEFNWGSPGKWNDMPNAQLQSYVCEWDTVDYVADTGPGNNTYQYNYWDGWNDPDSNSDGIVDVPYRVNNNGLYFDGVDDYADLTDFAVSENFTIEIWINPFTTTVKGGSCIIGKHTSTDGNLLLLFFNSSALYYIDDTAWYYLGEISSGWQQLSLIIERNVTHTSYQCFKNGNLLKSGTRVGSVADYTGKPWTLGQDWDTPPPTPNPTNFYYGIIDELRVLNGTLTTAEIREDCSSPTTHYPARADTVAWYHLNETSGTLIQDYSGNGYDGSTKYGASWSDEVIALDLSPRVAPIWIDSNDDFANFSSSGTGTSIDPYIIENQQFFSNQTTLLDIRNTDAFFVISNSIFNGLNGSNNLIYLDDVNYGRILNNTISNTTSYGISCAGGSSYNTISGNTIHDCGSGIAVLTSNNNTVSENRIYNLHTSWGYGIILDYGSSSNTVSRNNITGNWNYQNQIFGISVYASSSNQNTISGNTITDVGFYGMHIAYSTHHNKFSGNNISNVGMYGIRANLNAHSNTYSTNFIQKSYIGIWFDNSSDNLVIGNIISDSTADGILLSSTSRNNLLARNTISDASDDGICLSFSDNNTISHNVLSDCNSFGVNLVYSNKCLVTGNNFINNNVGGPPTTPQQAYDNNSEKNNNFSYNYWDDWTSPDVNADGFVDGPYYLDPFQVANDDRYPRTTPVPLLIIVSPLAGTYVSSLITVTLDGAAPLYWYYIEGIDVQNHTWTVSTDRSLVDGTHTLHAFSMDANGIITHDSETFTIDTIAPVITITSPTNTTYSQNSVTLTYSVSDGIFTLYLDNVVDTTASGSVVSALTDGIHNLTIVAVDAVGNVGKTTVIFTVDPSFTTSATTTATGTVTTSIPPSDTSKTTTTSKPGSFPGIMVILSFFTILVVFTRRSKRT